MNKEFHDIDKLFRSALDKYESTPSSRVKERLAEELDRQDAESFRKKFIRWKRATLLLLLVLSGFIVYETGILKIGSHQAVERTAGKQRNQSSLEKNNKTLQTTINPNHTIENTVNADRIDKLPAQKEIDLPARIGIYDNPISQYHSSEPGITYNPNNQENEQSITFPGIKTTRLSQKEKISSPQLDPSSSITKNGLIPFGIPGLQNVVDSIFRKITSKQFTEKNSHLQPFWMMIGFVSYDQAGYRLDSDEPDAISSIKYSEAHEPSFSLGILITRQLRDRWGLQSGIIYSNTAIGMKPQKTYAFKDPTGAVAYKYNSSSGYAFIKPGFRPQPLVGDSLTTAEAKHTINNLAIPLEVRYTLTNGKLSVAPGLGIEANIITRASLEVDIEDAANSENVFVKNLNGTKSFYCSFVADAELRYNLNKKWSLTVRPAYNLAITPITKDNIVETFPYSFRIGAGVTAKF